MTRIQSLSPGLLAEGTVVDRVPWGLPEGSPKVLHVPSPGLGARNPLVTLTPWGVYHGPVKQGGPLGAAHLRCSKEEARREEAGFLSICTKSWHRH